ncbi:hypothetical protein ACFSTE_11425 [Aquimarina hainanensis]|uniref:Bacteriocin-type signal sequence-containing protein n=1 Tax=Aquimarina hainanensis TaxID=1578017 RepID=A0ABW5N7D3_9FLAO|nr:hypothetical protein [Aquimarina sp. TRL1]QKX05423.1 hypothetical protein HN014_11020 [Aquimarina sp. TRL1]
MKKNILNLIGTRKLNKKEQQTITGGTAAGNLRIGGGIGSTSLELCEGLTGMDLYCCEHPQSSACTAH